MAPKILRGIVWRIALGAHFSVPFPRVDFFMGFGRPLATFGFLFGSLLVPFGSYLLPRELDFDIVWVS